MRHGGGQRVPVNVWAGLVVFFHRIRMQIDQPRQQIEPAAIHIPRHPAGLDGGDLAAFKPYGAFDHLRGSDDPGIGKNGHGFPL